VNAAGAGAVCANAEGIIKMELTPQLAAAINNTILFILLS
jgi:hypothetical protein